jgi:hypothetical protein
MEQQKPQPTQEPIDGTEATMGTCAMSNTNRSRHMPTDSEPPKVRDEFLSGVFSVMQHLVLIRDEPGLAVEIANMNSIKRDWALRESRLTGFRVREMNRFIREELRP